MSANHKPATPLPWKIVWTTKRVWLEAPKYGTICGTGDSIHGNDLEFAAHAANSYSKLVEALHGIASANLNYQHAAFNRDLVGCAVAEAEQLKAKEQADALLRELGEAS